MAVTFRIIVSLEKNHTSDIPASIMLHGNLYDVMNGSSTLESDTLLYFQCLARITGTISD
jgi:hypothetical protein